jgi:hypothetical protein
MFSKAARVRLRKFHRWTGVVIGIQLLIWVSSGLYFSWVPIEVVKDEDRNRAPSPVALPMERVVAPQALPLSDGFQVKNLRLDFTPAGPQYRLESTTGQVQVFDAFSGQAARFLSPGQVSELAMRQMQSQDKPTEVNFLETGPADYKGPLPVYQVVLDDFRETRIYTDPWSGRVIVRRNMFWRIYDFLWMLHIMDFDERENFNNPWIKILSLAALFVVMSGYFLFFFGRSPRKQMEGRA